MSEVLPRASKCHVGVSLAHRRNREGKVEQVPYFAVTFAAEEDAKAALEKLEKTGVQLVIQGDGEGFRYWVEKRVKSKNILAEVLEKTGPLWECRPDEATHQAFLEALRNAGKWFLALDSETGSAQGVIESKFFSLRFSER